MSSRTFSSLLVSTLLLSVLASTLAAQTLAATGQISTVAGKFINWQTQLPLNLREGEPAINSDLEPPTAVAAEPDGTFYFTVGSCIVAKVDSSGVLTRLAGQFRSADGESNGCGFSGDGGSATAANLSRVGGLAVDSVAHRLYIADSDNYRVRAIDLSSGIIDTVMGIGTINSAGDDAFLDDFSEVSPEALATDKEGNLFVFDQSHYRLLRREASSGVVTRVAGKGSPYRFNEPAPNQYVVVGLGDGGDAKAAGIAPHSLAVDQQGNIYLGETKFVRRIDAATGIINTVAGFTWKVTDSTRPGPNYNQTGPALNLGLTGVYGIATSPDGHVFFSDVLSYLIYRLDPASSHVDIMNRTDFADDDMTPKQVSLAMIAVPWGLAFDGAGNLLVADHDHNVIRRVENAATMHVGNVPVGNFAVSALAGGVAAADGVSLTFDSTTAAGDATLTKTSGGTPPPPTGFKLGTPSTYFNITTTATFTGTVSICINYSGTAFADPSQLKLYHYDHSGAWVDITSSLSPGKTLICGITDSFSPFAIVEPGTAAPPVDLAIRKTAPARADSGKNLSYLLGVANLSQQTAAGVTISDTLPAGATFVSAYWGKASCSVNQGKLVDCSSSGNPAACTVSGRTVTCPVGALTGIKTSQPAGALAVITVKVTAPRGAILSNTGTVTATNPDSNAANNSSTVSTQISK